MNEALDTDEGLIAIALEVYADFVKMTHGPLNLQIRALNLSTKFRNKALSVEPAWVHAKPIKFKIAMPK